MRRLILVFLSLCYALIISKFMPVLSSKDYMSYYYYSEMSGVVLLKRFDAGIEFFLLNEPLWLLINIFASSIVGGTAVFSF
jgi:hypothetical protein